MSQECTCNKPDFQHAICPAHDVAASQAPAAPQVDVEGLVRTIIERVAKDAVMLAIVRWSLEWDKDALEMTDEDIAKDAVDCCTGDEMGCLDEAEATPENCTHVFVAEQLRKHLPPAAAPVGQSYRYKEVFDLAKSYAAQPPSDISVLARALVSFLGESSPQGWVRVEDELPQVGAWCWVVVVGVVQRMAANLAGDEWEWADREADFAPKDVVSHWQPLPAPPSAHPGEDGR